VSSSSGSPFKSTRSSSSQLLSATADMRTRAKEKGLEGGAWSVVGVREKVKRTEKKMNLAYALTLSDLARPVVVAKLVIELSVGHLGLILAQTSQATYSPLCKHNGTKVPLPMLQM
jgi:hypothetical protein